MKLWLPSILLTFILSSCGMDFMYLFPYELNENSHFAQYDEDVGDTLQLDFDSLANPHFSYVNGSKYDPSYSIKNVFFEGDKGKKLDAWIMEPKTSSNGTSIFFLHGNAGHVVYMYQLALPFVERGYKVFLFDYSEFGFSEGKAKRKFILDDALYAFDYMQSREEFKNDQIVIYGQSLGGHLASVVGTIKQKHVDAMVIEGAFSSHKDIAADRVPFFGRIFVAEKYSGKDSIPNFDKPLLVIHSLDDKTVPFELGKKLYDHATEPKSFYQIDSCHICGPLLYPDSISMKIQNMLE